MIHLYSLIERTRLGMITRMLICIPFHHIFTLILATIRALLLVCLCVDFRCDYVWQQLYLCTPITEMKRIASLICYGTNAFHLIQTCFSISVNVFKTSQVDHHQYVRVTLILNQSMNLRRWQMKKQESFHHSEKDKNVEK